MAIARATDRDLPEALALLGALHLPQDDVAAQVGTMAMAREHGVDTVFLLTTTAERFVPTLGFEQVWRADVPESVRASVQLRSACPRSATVMRKRMAPARCPGQR